MKTPVHEIQVLIVDDNPTNLKLVTYLVRAYGYEVDTAGDADAALARIREHAPQLILLDLQLQGIAGLELTRRLTADPTTRTIAILAFMAYARNGADDRAR